MDNCLNPLKNGAVFRRTLLINMEAGKPSQSPEERGGLSTFGMPSLGNRNSSLNPLKNGAVFRLKPGANLRNARLSQSPEERGGLSTPIPDTPGACYSLNPLKNGAVFRLRRAAPKGTVRPVSIP